MQSAARHEFQNERRDLARARWGGARPGAGAKPGKQILRDVDRAAELFDLTDSPYQQLAFAGLSVPDLMLICAKNLMESRDFKTASRILKHLHVNAEPQPAGFTGPAPDQPEPDTYVLAHDEPPAPDEPDEPEPPPRRRHHAHLLDGATRPMAPPRTTGEEGQGIMRETCPRHDPDPPGPGAPRPP